MSLLTVVRDVCAVVGVTQPPTSVFTNINTNRTMSEMVALANEMAQRIAYDAGRDWQMLKALHTFTGDGVASSGLLPSSFKRMLLTANVWRSTSTQQPMCFISDFDEWTQRRAANETDAWGEWIIYGGRMHIHPVLAGPIAALPGPPIVPAVPAVTATFAYLDRNCIALASGGFGDTFMADGDAYRLDERLLKLGMIYQWKANKGSPYAEDMGSFSDALAMEMGHDKPSPILIGGRPIGPVNIRADTAGWVWPLTGSVGPSP